MNPSTGAPIAQKKASENVGNSGRKKSAGAPSSAGENPGFFYCWDFWVLHLACLAAFWTGVSWTAVGVCIGFYYLRMFAVTGWMHRYFSHRTFKTSRPVQFLFALLANSAVQRDPIWWAAHHRHHHRHSDTPQDSHSPRQRGFWYSHMLWFLTPNNRKVKWEYVKDLAKYPELVWIHKHSAVVPMLTGVGMFGFGVLLERVAPGLGTNGWQMLVWGFVISTVLLLHGTYTINSFGHIFGKRRYETSDDSRNSFLFALVTMGEGWHNNHHFYQNSTRQGFYWWEFDPSYYLLWTMSKLGLIWDLKSVPLRLRESWRNNLSAASRSTSPEAVPK